MEENQVNSEIEIKNMSYEFVITQHMNRILAITSREFGGENGNEAKILALNMAVRFLKSSIPKELLKGKKFEEINVDSTEPTREKFKKVQDMYEKCVDILASNGYLYTKSVYGGYDD